MILKIQGNSFRKLTIRGDDYAGKKMQDMSKKQNSEAPFSGSLHFRCNICGSKNLVMVAALQREEPSCKSCFSTVRMRGMVHSLSLALFGKSIPIPDFPERKDIVGKGMSDWDGYAIPLANKLSYINTFYHKQPLLDITKITPADENRLDFVLSSDVFEHIVPPVCIAFENVRKMLKKRGVFVFSVPYSLETETVEHFPNLHKYHIETRGGQRVLLNETHAGSVEEFENLIFHGGDGETLEVRIFSECGLLKQLEEAGFKDVSIMCEPFFEHGIFWQKPWSVPIIARIASPLRIIDWGPRSSKLGKTSNIQASGRSGIWIKADKNVVSSDLEMIVGDKLAEELTIDGQIITALIPKSILKKTGRYGVVINTKDDKQAHVGEFTVYE